MNDATSMIQRSLKLTRTTAQLTPNIRLMLKELGMNMLLHITTHTAQTRCAEAGRKFLECLFTGEDLHSEYQIVTKRSRNSLTK